MTPPRAVDVVERMDAEDLPAPVYAAVLADLARVNTATLARRPTLAFAARAAARSQGTLRVLDVGFGDGDMLRALARWGAARGVALELVGIDLNPNSAPTARATTPDAARIDYRTGDYAALGGERWDAVISSLVAHHMSEAERVAFVRWMEAHARVGWFVNDLRRSHVARAGFRLLAGAMRAHPIVRHDGALSVLRGFVEEEWRLTLAEAAVDARVFRAFPFRLCVERLR